MRLRREASNREFTSAFSSGVVTRRPMQSACRIESCRHGPAAHGSSVLDPYPNAATVVGVEHSRPVVGPKRLRPTKSDENGGFLPCPTGSLVQLRLGFSQLQQ